MALSLLLIIVDCVHMSTKEETSLPLLEVGTDVCVKYSVYEDGSWICVHGLTNANGAYLGAGAGFLTFSPS